MIQVKHLDTSETQYEVKLLDTSETQYEVKLLDTGETQYKVNHLDTRPVTAQVDVCGVCDRCLWPVVHTLMSFRRFSALNT